MTNLDRANYLWEEYKYRHDLIWKLLFRVTFVAVVLTITPFTISKPIRDGVHDWLTLLPILAILLAVGSCVLLATEFWLFRPIDTLYRWFRGLRPLPCHRPRPRARPGSGRAGPGRKRVTATAAPVSSRSPGS